MTDTPTPDPEPGSAPSPARAKRARREGRAVPILGGGVRGLGEAEARGADPTAVIEASDLLRWILGVVARFPRSARFGLGARLEAAASDVLEHLVTAQYCTGARRHQALTEANLRSQVARHLLRLAGELGLVAKRQALHGFELTMALGRQIGGWRKSLGGSPGRAMHSSSSSATPGT